MKSVWGKWFLAYMIAWFISGVGGSIYYTYSRPYLMDRLGSESYYIVGLLLAAEQIPLFLAVLSGFIADFFGRRNLLLIGLLNVPLYILLGYIDPYLIPIVIGLKTVIGSISSPAGMGMVLSATNRSGKAYSLLAFISAIGWVVGGVIPGLLKDYIGPIGLFSLTGLTVGVSILIQYFYAPEKERTYERPNVRELVTVIRGTWDLLLASILALAALSLFFTVMSLKVYEEIHKNLLIYGLALSTSTALAGAFVRPFSGVLVDRFNPLTIIILSLIAYIALDTGIYLSSGIYRLILWIIPIYPFRDTAMVIAFSRRVSKKLQATVAGVNATTTSLSGLIVFLLVNLTGGDINLIYYIHIVLIIASTLILLYSRLKIGLKTYTD